MKEIDAGLPMDKVAEVLQRNFPMVWKRIYTKHIDGPGQYMGYKSVAVALTATVVDALQSVVEDSGGTVSQIGHVAMVAGVLEKYDFPVYHVAESLFNALAHTHPPKDMTWEELLPLRYEGMIFMLPRGVLFEPEAAGGKEIYLLGIAVLPAGDRVYMPGTGLQLDPAPHTRIDVFWACKPSGLLRDCSFPEIQLLEPERLFLEERLSAYESAQIVTKDLPEGEFSSRLSGIVANLILCMQVRKELVQPGTRTGKKLKSGAVVHTPTFLGANYLVQRREHVSSTPGAHFTDLGWRGGHWKRQWYGKGHTESKIILIDPYIAYCKTLVRDEESCYADEKRTMDGGCSGCGDPAL